MWQTRQQTKSLQERLSKFVADAREKVSSLPAGHERDKLLQKLELAEAAAKLEAKGKPVDFNDLLRLEPNSGSTNIRNTTSKHSGRRKKVPVWFAMAMPVILTTEYDVWMRAAG
jgi:hypothetical protein